MRTLTKIKKLFGTWEPKENLVYCSKVVVTPTKHTTDKYIAVVIQINHKNYLGTFLVKDGFCEIRCKKLNAILPANKLEFDKKQKYFDLTEQGSQRHLDVIYTVKVYGYDEEDISRFKKKHKSKKLKFDKIKLYFPKRLSRESKELIKKENYEAVLLEMVKYFPNKEFWRRFT